MGSSYGLRQAAQPAMACNTTLAPSASTNSYDLDPSSKTLWLAFTSQTSKRRSITGAKKTHLPMVWLCRASFALWPRCMP